MSAPKAPAQTSAKSPGQGFAKSTSPVVTKAERDALIAARPKPKAEMHLTPGGAQETETKRTVNSMLEARIAAMTMRLERAREGMRAGHAKALNRANAKAGFERSR